MIRYDSINRAVSRALGIDFVKNGARIPSYVLVFDDRVIGVSETTVDINDCLGDKFDYRNLMEGL